MRMKLRAFYGALFYWREQLFGITFGADCMHRFISCEFLCDISQIIGLNVQKKERYFDRSLMLNFCFSPANTVAAPSYGRA